MTLNRKLNLTFWVGIGFAVFFFLIGIWGGDDRFSNTGGIILIPALVAGVVLFFRSIIDL